MSEELIKLLTDTAGYLRDTRNHAWPYVESGQQFQDMLNIAARIDSTLSALSAQQSQQEPTEPVATEGYWWCRNCKAEIGAYHVTYQECHEDCGHKVEWITPVTATASGVRAGMLRAAEICKEWEGKLSQGAGYAIRTAREAITSAADQVNADQPADAVVVSSACEWQLSDEFEGDTWDGQCGAKWTFTEAGPDENDMHYCPSCGGKLTIRAAQEEK